ncbi:MAG: hypothetical protein HQK51_18665 [Oligoflexia bacterium]|nr:hypothetical protein [Oligoflexia bacterium]
MKKIVLMALMFVLSFPLYAQASEETAADTIFNLLEDYPRDYRCERLNYFECIRNRDCNWDSRDRRCESRRDHRDSCEDIRYPSMCERTPGCDWDRYRNRCERRGGGHGNYCEDIRNPRICERTPGCDWDRYRNRCERGRGEHRNYCDRIYNRFQCERTPECHWDVRDNRCNDRRHYE